MHVQVDCTLGLQKKIDVLKIHFFSWIVSPSPYDKLGNIPLVLLDAIYHDVDT